MFGDGSDGPCSEFLTFFSTNQPSVEDIEHDSEPLRRTNNSILLASGFIFYETHRHLRKLLLTAVTGKKNPATGHTYQTQKSSA
jgi:hypothetical protein